jgi:hypothetical protein
MTLREMRPARGDRFFIDDYFSNIYSVSSRASVMIVVAES